MSISHLMSSAFIFAVANILPNSVKPLPSFVLLVPFAHLSSQFAKKKNLECKTVMKCQSMSQKCFICELNSVTCCVLFSVDFSALEILCV